MFRKQTFNHAMRRNQNLVNEQVTSKIVDGKPLPFNYRSRSNSRDNRDTSRQSRLNKNANSISKPYFGNNKIKPSRRSGSPYRRRQNFLSNKLVYNKKK